MKTNYLTLVGCALLIQLQAEEPTKNIDNKQKPLTVTCDTPATKEPTDKIQLERPTWRQDKNSKKTTITIIDSTPIKEKQITVTN
jgi:hypothetical protein